MKPAISNCIHKGRFYAIKNDCANNHDHQHKAKTVEQIQRVDRAAAQEGEAEGFDDGGHGVELDDPLEAFGDGGAGVDDRGGVHEEGDAEADQEAQVAVLGGEGGDEDAESEAEAGHHQHQDGGEGDPTPVGLDGRADQDKIEDEGEEESELDGEGDQVGDEDGDGDGEAGEVDLAEEVGIADEGVAGLGEAVGEVGPDDGAGHVEEELGQAVGGELGDAGRR